MGRPPLPTLLSLFWLLLLPLLAGPAAAGEVPENALSQSLRIRPQFLDGDGLVFAFPQRAAKADAQLFSFSGLSALGAIARTERAGLFVLTQGTPAHLPGGTTFYQAGWAVTLSSFSLGAAVRGAYRRDEEYSERRPLDPEDPFDYYGESVLERTVQGSVGLGLQAGLFEFDVVLDWERSAIESGRLDRFFTADTLWAQGDSRVDGAWGASARAAIPLGDRAAAVLFGSWIRPENDYRYAFLADTLFVEHEGASELESWQAGAAFRFPTDLVDRVTLFSMVRVRHWIDLTSSYEPGAQFSEYRNWWLGASVEHELDGRWIVRAGIDGRYEKREDDSDRLGTSARYLAMGTAETTGSSFSWGTGYRWKNIRLDGSVSTNLDLWDLFPSLDAHILF